jgi:hypothetical protein
MAQFQPFALERWMSQFEQEVEYNLSESGVHPLPLSELLADDPRLVDELLATGRNCAKTSPTCTMAPLPTTCW